MKKPLALLAILGLSTSAFATPILVSYSGTVTSVLGDAIGYGVGDTIAGQVIIETDLAVLDPGSSPEGGVYRGLGSGFVDGFPGGNFASADQVNVRDNQAGFDGYQVVDRESGETNGEYLENFLLLSVASRSLDFTTSSSLLQDFSLSSTDFAAETNFQFRGQLDMVRSLGFFGRVRFDLDTFSVSTRSVPEPSTLSLMAAAAGLAFAFRRRKARLAA